MTSTAIRQVNDTHAAGATPTTTGVPSNTGLGDAGLATGITIMCSIIMGTIIVSQLLKQLVLLHQTASRRRNGASRHDNSHAIYNSYTADLESSEQPPPSYSTTNLLVGGTPFPSFDSSRSGGGDKIPPPPYTRVALPGTAVIANHTQTTSHHVSWTVVESIELTENHPRPGTGNLGGGAGSQGTERHQAANSRLVWWPLPMLGFFLSPVLAEMGGTLWLLAGLDCRCTIWRWVLLLLQGQERAR